MNLQEYLAHLNQGKCVQGGSELHAFMTKVSHEAMKITSELVFCADRQRGRRDVRVVSALSYGLRKKYHGGEKCVYQFRLSFSGSGRNPDRKWSAHRS